MTDLRVRPHIRRLAYVVKCLEGFLNRNYNFNTNSSVFVAVVGVIVVSVLDSRQVLQKIRLRLLSSSLKTLHRPIRI